jgi:hypothetical protein
MRLQVRAKAKPPQPLRAVAVAEQPHQGSSRLEHKSPI